jgi:ubiquinone/menaquinone biosynthesis C-methylase UbiE
MQLEKQVKRDHYQKEYDDLNRFVSYFYQKEIIQNLNVKNILEIGVGNKTLSNYLKQQGLHITTCDFDERLNPDFIADIRKLPFNDNKFDCVVAFEILEHLPFKYFSTCLIELYRTSRRYVVLSIPYSSIYFEFLVRFPFITKIIKRDFLRFFISIPFISHKFLSKEHYWELGRKGYSLKKIRKIIKKKFKIIKEIRPPIDTYHYFFVLEKK